MNKQEISFDTVIISTEIKQEDRLLEMQNYMINDLKAEQRSRTTYEFIFQADFKWENLVAQVQDIIDTDTDTVCIWDIDQAPGKETLSLFRTKIGR